MPHGWEEALAAVAIEFHFTRADLWALDLEEFLFWLEHVNRIRQQRQHHG